MMMPYRNNIVYHALHLIRNSEHVRAYTIADFAQGLRTARQTEVGGNPAANFPS